MMLTRRGVCAAAGAATLGGKSARADSNSVVTIPMKLSEDRFWTSVWIDGKGPFRFLLDTGSNGYALRPKVIDEINLKYAPSINMAGVTGQATAHRDYYAGEIVIGGVLRDRNVIFTSVGLGGDRCVGLLPAELLVLRRTDVDFMAGELRIYEQGAPDLKGFERLHWVQTAESGRGFGFNGRFATHVRMVVDVRLDGAPYRLTLDTGTPNALVLSSNAVRRHGLWTKYPKFVNAIGRGVNEAFSSRLVRMNTLEIGSTKMNSPIVELIDPNINSLEEGTDGLLGLETLRRFTLSIDSNDQAIWFKPNDLAGQAFRYNRSGLGLRRAEDRLTVASVQPDSPAAKAGVAVGDAIVLPDAMSGQAFRRGLTDGPGTVITFQVQRGDKVEPIRLVLQDLI